MDDLKSWGLSSSMEKHQKGRGTGDRENRGLKEGQNQIIEELPSNGRDRRKCGGWGAGGEEWRGLGAGHSCVGAERILQAALLHHRHPENKRKQRDPALQEPPTQPPPQRHYPMPSKSEAATNLGPRIMSQYLWSIMLATSDSLPSSSCRKKPENCLYCLLCSMDSAGRWDHTSLTGC